MAYLQRTLGSPTSSNNWTFSGWVSLNDRGADDFDYIFSYGDPGGSQGAGFAWRATNDSGNPYQAFYYNASSSFHQNDKYYDTSSYYHIVVKCTNGTITAYMNGELLSSITCATPAMASGENFYIGKYNGAFHTLEGRFNDCVFVDGQSLNPTAFAERDTATNGWKPQSPAEIRSTVGNFGNNGFFLTFEDADNLGHDYKTADRSSNNDFTETGGSLVATISGADNKFAKGNWLFNENGYSIFYDNGALRAYGNNTAHTICRSTHGLLSGKWYWETKRVGSDPRTAGICNEMFAPTGNYLGQNENGWGMYWDGSSMNCAHNGSVIATFSQAQTSEDILMWAFDADTGKLWMGLNGTWLNSGDPAAGTGNIWTTSVGNTSGMYFPAYSAFSSSKTWHFNFGDPTYSVTSPESDSNGEGKFSYAPPTNFLAICDKNFPSVDINPTDYFQTDNYTGNNGTSRLIETGFPTDLALVTAVSGSDTGFFHRMSDRALLNFSGNTYIDTSKTAVYQGAVNDYIAAFENNGFRVTKNGTGGANNSGSIYNYQAWRAGGQVSLVADSNGANVRRTTNADSGLCVLNYAGNGQSRDIPHGLGKAPKFLLLKGNQTSDWRCYHVGLGSATTLHIPNSQSSYIGTNHGYLRGTAPDATNLYLPNTSYNGHGNAWESNTNGVQYTAWLWSQIPGFSQFGTYRGDSSNRMHVTTNFRPALVVIFWISGSGSPGTNMRVFSEALMPNRTRDNQDVWYWSNAGGQIEQNGLDFHSNGFTVELCGDVNAGSSGNTYAYCAWASTPYIHGETAEGA